MSMVLGPAINERWRSPELAVHARTPAERFEEIRGIALSYLGRPYVSGGVGSPGFDCSGFICRVFAEAGYALPRVSRDQARAGLRVRLKDIQPGDLLFFVAQPGRRRIAHVGLYLGNGELVHASTTNGEVEVASLKMPWFRKRFVAARRILRPQEGNAYRVRTASTAPGSLGPGPPLAPTYELIEHTGETALMPALRRPPARAAPSLGPELTRPQDTAVGVRAAMVTDDGNFGLTLAPELALIFESIALRAELAVPVRFPIGAHPTLGKLDRPADFARFLREAALGLRGADLELRVSQLGDASLLDGVVLSALAPGVLASGVPGLSVWRAPLGVFGAVRSEDLRAEVLLDDATDPGLGGASLALPVGDTDLWIGLAGATDQHGVYGTGRRAVDAAEAGADLTLIPSEAWTFVLGGSGAAVQALGESGFGAEARASAEHHFDHAVSAVRVVARGGYLGPRYIGRIFGPTYLVSRAETVAALASAAAGRGTVGGELDVILGRFTLGAMYDDGLGRRSPFDRQAGLLLDVGHLPAGGTRFFDLRVACFSRAPVTGVPAASVVHGGARMRLSSWLSGEVYLEASASLQGGAGLTGTFGA